MSSEDIRQPFIEKTTRMSIARKHESSEDIVSEDKFSDYLYRQDLSGQALDGSSFDGGATRDELPEKFG
jgi:hypothetical protein